MDHRAHALDIARRFTAGLDDAAGVALVGSVARGTDHPHSDIDLIAAADTRPGTTVHHVEGRMVTLTRKTPADLAAAFTHPWEAGAAVPAWRSALILRDSGEALAGLQARARDWTWDAIADACDRWAAAELVGLAEEVHKIHGMLALARPRAAAANRLLLALSLAAPLAAAGRVSYESENDLWDNVAAAEGPAWARAWDLAAGVAPAGHEAGCRAALDLYRHAADRLIDHLDANGRAVVDTARRL
ncbi:nucleotidyltransferase domain-containing protein [Glycomyces terrestris]|uniref:Nucleotidyltransferase domain-containing protein n=1 Tax=Glycomyces terrestris TaxID=2493553 RepID=A0A426UVI8_9ACTN|nr:nucleotidyltransferase domain-containing protein [Glycomyces terrestris]RRR98330.1 nucleotidyltransferase domain-containing protein [Glycomyces terrestris]